MVERKILVATIIIVFIASVAGYSIGQFSAPTEQVTTTSSITITEVQTITTTSTSKITETITSTTIIGKDLLIPSPVNSSAIIRGRLLLDGTVFVTFSIDKSTYSIGEIVHIKTTISNLSPNNMSFRLGGQGSGTMIEVGNSTNGWVWIYPEFPFVFNNFPLPPVYFDVLAGETKIIAWMTADWNMKGLHHSSGNVSEYYLPWNSTGLSLIGNFYNDYFVSEGQYTVTWPSSIAYVASGSWHSENFEERIQFTITKQD